MSSFLKDLLAGVLIVLSPIKLILVGLFILIIFDTITGLIRARKTGESITSNEFGRIAGKFVLYNIGVITGLIIQEIFIPGINVVGIIGTALAVREAKSILENVNTFLGHDILADVIKKISPKHKKRLKKDDNK